MTISLPARIENPRFNRILLKLSGEALLGNKAFGIDASIECFGFAGCD